jgi:hypothetical protein
VWTLQAKNNWLSETQWLAENIPTLILFRI